MLDPLIQQLATPPAQESLTLPVEPLPIQPARLTGRKAFRSMIVALLLTGRVSFQSTRMYPIDWKEILLINKAHCLVDQKETGLEGFPSDQQGTCTLLTRRVHFQPKSYKYLTSSIGSFFFQSMRCLYLINQKESLPVNKGWYPVTSLFFAQKHAPGGCGQVPTNNH
jgi:hypothetical protein